MLAVGCFLKHCSYDSEFHSVPVINFENQKKLSAVEVILLENRDGTKLPQSAGCCVVMSPTVSVLDQSRDRKQKLFTYGINEFAFSHPR